MYGERGMAMLVDPDQWARCAHSGTVLLAGGGVGLDWAEVPPSSRWDEEAHACNPTPVPPPPACPAGLAHDRWCRTWRTHPELGTVEVSRPPSRGCPDALRRPTGVAVDAADRLYIVESAARVVLVADLWAGRVLTRLPVAGRPLDVVAWGGPERPGVLVLTRSSVLRVEGRGAPCPVARPLRAPCGRPGLRPARIAVLSGRPVILWRDAHTAVVADLSGAELLEVPGASDLEGGPDGLLVLGVGPGDPIRRFREADGALREDEPVAADGYDGAAVTINPEGRIVYTTAEGTRSTQGPQARHVRRGLLTTYRLDSGAYRTRWGRVFIDACLPVGTGLRVRSLTTDEDEVADPMPAAPAARGTTLTRDDVDTPPLPPVDGLDPGTALPVVARIAPDGPTGSAPLLADPPLAGDGWTAYESGVAAGPGRYLWLQLELTGTERTSPKVRALRVERPGHSLLAALPRMYSSVDEQADFLHGFLTAAEGVLHDLDTAAAERRRLVDPSVAPSEFLTWLASLTGIVLDQRWPESARRRLLAEVFSLYARRGTSLALERILELYLGRRAAVVERWRLRGLGGGFLGLDPVGLDAPTVAGATRRSGMLGHFTIGGQLPGSDSYDRFAHRFTVLVPGRLTEEQREVVVGLVARHKPSHTLGDVCELGDGLPVGRLRLGLTAYVGPRAGRSTGVLGQARLGQGGTLGTPEQGARLGGTRLGGVRVG